MKNYKPVVSALVIASLLPLMGGCGVGEASVADRAAIEAATPVPVETATPIRSDIYATYEATAAITTDSDAPVAARVAGELVELLVEEGDSVQAGQVLARLDGERLRLEMLAAKAELERARKEYKRNIGLNERGLISASMFEGLKYDLNALEASYKLKQLNYDYSNIRAPISGVVSAREIKPGQNVSAGDVVFRVTETSELLAYLQIPQKQLPKFQAGHMAAVQVASMPDTSFRASIVRISPTIDTRNGTFKATVSIDNNNGDLAPGMLGRFTIAYEKHTAALTIPADALVNDDEQTSVYVVSKGEVTKRTVETGIETDGKIEILAGLSDDELIVVVGHGGLQDGSKVLASTTVSDSFSG
ncbi:MAG: efflux RND transporter periplasmic adaptor subunit [Gammaproteobacteria bacterium]|nr:efflux RND transporter periplasmic adaptor subunit [Gammaproteobacteria bacterium]